MPRISVLMSAYNAEKYLPEALESIRNQTFSDWECIIMDDCSTDRTWNILEQYAADDLRFRIEKNEENMHLPASLNRGLSYVHGEYIMRTDADDICRRDRMEKQLAFMEQNPELDMSCCKIFELTGNEVVPISPLREGLSETMAAMFLFFNPIFHSGVMIKTDVLREFGYNPEFLFAEDYDLWTRIIEKNRKIAIQDEYLMLYRIHEHQVSTKYTLAQTAQYKSIVDRFYQNTLWKLSDEELEFLAQQVYYRNPVTSKQFRQFVDKILAVNRQKHFFSTKAIRHAAFEFYILRRRLFKDKATWLAGVFKLGPFFVIFEVISRVIVWCGCGKKIVGAAEAFGLEIREYEGKKRFYWNV